MPVTVPDYDFNLFSAPAQFQFEGAPDFQVTRIYGADSVETSIVGGNLF